MDAKSIEPLEILYIKIALAIRHTSVLLTHYSMTTTKLNRDLQAPENI
jgi:hypothetical protein